MKLEIMVLPSLHIEPGKPAIPMLYLPRGYKAWLPEFFESHCDEWMDDYAKEVSKRFGFEISLSWDEKIGLKHIRVGTETALDFERGRFIAHNLDDVASLERPAALFIIATTYMALLSEQSPEA